MRITDYFSLKLAIQSYLYNRTDLAEACELFVQQCEAQLNRRLRLTGQLVHSQRTLTAGVVVLPSDFLALKSIEDLSGNVLEWRGPDEFLRLPERAPTGRRYYTLARGLLSVNGALDAANPMTVRLVYYARLPSLTNATPSHWALTRYPDMYLFGSLAQSAPYLAEDERVSVWAGLFTESWQAAMAEDEAANVPVAGARVLAATEGLADNPFAGAPP